MTSRPKWWESGGGLYDQSYYQEPPGGVAISPAFVKSQASYIIKTCGLRRGNRVLEIACGAGQVSTALAARGLDVIGIDINDYFLSRARRSARKARVHARFMRLDMRQLPFDDAEFKTVVVCGSSLGIFRREADNMMVFKEMLRVLKPGGRIFLEGWIPYTPAEIRKHTKKNASHWDQNLPRGGVVHCTTWHDKKRRSYIVLEYPEKTLKIDYKVYSDLELRRIFHSFGIGVEHIDYIEYWNWRSCERTSKQARRLVCVAQKPR